MNDSVCRTYLQMKSIDYWAVPEKSESQSVSKNPFGFRIDGHVRHSQSLRIHIHNIQTPNLLVSRFTVFAKIHYTDDSPRGRVSFKRNRPTTTIIKTTHMHSAHIVCSIVRDMPQSTLKYTVENTFSLFDVIDPVVFEQQLMCGYQSLMCPPL